MSALQALIEKSKAKQNTFFELLGFVVLAAGIFCGLALLTYDPTDPTQIATTSETYRNMGGPVGARLASVLLSTLGMVSNTLASQAPTHPKSTRLNSNHLVKPYGVLCLEKKDLEQHWRA